MEMDLSSKIKRLRAERGMTLEQVATIVGVGKSTVRKWETGAIANMRRDKIDKLALALGTTPAYLMGWNKTIPIDEPKLTEGEEEFIELFRRLPDGEREMYLEVLRARLKK